MSLPTGRFDFETFKQILSQWEIERKKEWEREYQEAIEKLKKITYVQSRRGRIAELMGHPIRRRVKPKKVIIREEVPLISGKEYEQLKKEYQKLIEEKELPEWVLELLDRLRQVKVTERRLVIQTKSVLIKRLLKGEFPYTRRVELKGVSEEWHHAFIMPFTRNFLTQLGAFLDKWKLSDNVDLEVETPHGKVKITGYYAFTPIGHLFYADAPFLYALIPINAPKFEDATVKAVLIWNYHKEPLKLHIVHLFHNTEDVIEIPPDYILIFVHEFQRSLSYLKRKAEVEKALQKVEETISDEDLRRRIKKHLWRFAKLYEMRSPEEIYKLLREQAAKKILREIIEKLREVKKEWILI